MPNLILYQKIGSSCSIIAHSVLRVLGLPFQSVSMAMGPTGYEGADGHPSREEYLEVNPKGYVPTLVADGVVITEMPAILTFLADQAPERHMTGVDSFERAAAVEWMSFLSGTLHGTGYAALWRPSRFVAEDSAEDVQQCVTEGGRLRILHSYRYIESRLRGKPHAVGQQLTVVDLQLHLFWRWGKQIGLDMSEFPKFEALARAAEKQAGLRTAYEIEGIPLPFSS